jgi:uncharacterized membrane protein
MSLLVHIAAGLLALVAGFVALFAAKGGRLHRKSGMLFVFAMIALAVSGAGTAAIQHGEGSVVGGVLAGYLVATALLTVRSPFAGSRGWNVALMSIALALGVVSLGWGLQAVGTPSGSLDGIPAVMFFLFGVIALLAGLSDLRVLRSGAREGSARLKRHLWRMCFALYIASGSFFLGQADELPKALQVPALLAIPAFLPLAVMFYWLWRLRRKRARAQLLGIPSPETT